MASINARAWVALAAVAATMGLLVFGVAGTMRYWQAWVYLSIFLGVSLATTLDLMRNDPALLARRMRGGPFAEKEKTQRLIMTGASLGFIGLLVVPALDRRFEWSSVPPWVVVAGDVLVAVGFYLIFLVYRENTFAAATIEVAAGQTIVTTGPYAIVRHPMYAGALLYVVGSPLALGSYWGLLAAATVVLCLVWRLLDEERVLARELRGYREYQQRVRYRLVPKIW